MEEDTATKADATVTEEKQAKAKTPRLPSVHVPVHRQDQIQVISSTQVRVILSIHTMTDPLSTSKDNIMYIDRPDMVSMKCTGRHYEVHRKAISSI